MKLIIDIPDEAYNRLLEEQRLPNGLDIEYFIIHSTPLSEELEKLKVDIKTFEFLLDDLSPFKCWVVDLEDIEEVFTEHISEQKGGAE